MTNVTLFSVHSLVWMAPEPVRTFLRGLTTLPLKLSDTKFLHSIFRQRLFLRKIQSFLEGGLKLAGGGGHRAKVPLHPLVLAALILIRTLLALARVPLALVSLAFIAPIRTSCVPGRTVPVRVLSIRDMSEKFVSERRSVYYRYYRFAFSV